MDYCASASDALLVSMCMVVYWPLFKLLYVYLSKLEAKQSMVQHLIDALQAILDRGTLSSGHAGHVYGMLQFASTQLYGMIGKAILRPLVRRQHEC